MKSKKFVLAGLALLAITGLLALTSCKSDSVPPEVEKQEQGDGGGSETDKNNTSAKLVSISVTPPERTVYSERQSFDPTGMVVIATYDDKSQREVTGWETDFNTVAGEKGLGKTVTVSYREGNTTQDDTFTVDVVNVEEPTKLTSYSSPNNTGNDCTYIAFGEWPQTEAVDFKPTTASQSHGIFDGNYYVEGNDKYVEKDGKYYKVEPIVWRVLTEDYKDPDGNSTGNALLLAEKILTGGIRYYVDLNTRTITGAGTKEGEPDTVYPNNWQYSTIRAWLNGLDVVKSDDTQENDTTYTDKGFLQTAFTADAQSLIADTSVDNSAASTNPASNPKQWEEGENPYASNTPTTDKVFLLSEEEATNSEYGFDEYNRYVGDDYNTTTSTRIRVTTDYAKATGADQGDSSAGYGGWWWLRSPYYYIEYVPLARVIDYAGSADFNHIIVDSASGGVVPALSISLGGN